MKRIIKIIGLLCILLLDVVVGKYAITNFILCYSKTIGINVYGVNITGDGIVFFVQFLFLLLILSTIYFILYLKGINKKYTNMLLNYASIYLGIIMIIDVVTRMINYNVAYSAHKYVTLEYAIPYLIAIIIIRLIIKKRKENNQRNYR